MLDLTLKESTEDVQHVSERWIAPRVKSVKVALARIFGGGPGLEAKRVRVVKIDTRAKVKGAKFLIDALPQVIHELPVLVVSGSSSLLAPSFS